MKQKKQCKCDKIIRKHSIIRKDGSIVKMGEPDDYGVINTLDASWMHCNNHTKKEIEFLQESNAIEQVYDGSSLTNALKAWSFLLEFEKITEEVILKVHNILMDGKLLDHECGHFRTVPVYIGGKSAMNAASVKFAIAEWCDSMNMKQAEENTNERKEWYAKNDHVTYEKIHPFVDGNGRTGRMFMNWWRLKNGLPLLIIHEGQEQMQYYKWFKE